MTAVGLQIIKEAAWKYFSNGYIWVLLLISIAALFLITKRKKNAAAYVVLYSILYGAIILNPIVSVMLTRLGMNQVYWRAFWFIPIGILTACTFTHIVCSIKNTVFKNMAVIILCAVLIFSGGWMYNSDNFELSANPYKIPQYVVDVNEKLEDGCKITGDDYIVIWIRMLNPTITMPYGRQMILAGGNARQTKLHNLWNEETLNVRALVRRARNQKCDYILTEKSKKISEPWENYGLTLAAETDQYHIYAL